MRQRQRSRSVFNGRWIFTSCRPTDTKPLSALLMNLNQASGRKTSFLLAHSLSPVELQMKTQGCVQNVLIWEREERHVWSQWSLWKTYHAACAWGKANVVNHFTPEVVPVDLDMSRCCIHELHKRADVAFLGAKHFRDFTVRDISVRWSSYQYK